MGKDSREFTGANLESMETLKHAAIEAARVAGKLLMESLGKAEVIGTQYDSELVLKTKQDDASQALIIEMLRKQFPGHRILAEETKDHEIITESRFKWIIDPIDGTNNYLDGRDTFSVSLGLEMDGSIALGVVFLPKRNEMFVAEEGKGAFLNGEKIHVGDIADLSRAVVTFSTFAGREAETKHLTSRILRAIPHIKAFGFEKDGKVDPLFGRGSMAAEFCYVACGRIDGVIRLKQAPWDVAGGSLIAREAGAVLFNLQANEPSVYEGDYIAANPELSRKLRDLILE